MAIYKEITDEIIKENPKFFISAFNNHGGYSWCQVKDSKTGSVLPNCTGMAAGLFNLQYFLQTGKRNPLYEQAFRFEAQNFWWMVTEPNNERALLYGKLKYGKEVKKGGLMVWSDSKTKNGHVAYACEDEHDGKVKVLHSNSSGSGGKYFWETLNNKNGRWGYTNYYSYLGCIYPEFEWETIKVTDTVERNIYKEQVCVNSSTLRVRTEPSLKGEILGFAKMSGVYNVLDKKEFDNYIWLQIDAHNWIAKVDPYVELLLPEKKQEPEEKLTIKDLKPNDKVKIKPNSTTAFGTKLKKEWIYESEWTVLTNFSKTSMVIYAINPKTGKNQSILIKIDRLTKV